MSFPPQQQGSVGPGGKTGIESKCNNTNEAAGGKSSNQTSMDAMFQGLLPGSNSSSISPSNDPQLSSLNRLGSLGGMMHHGSPPTNNTNLGDGIKRLQQLHQISSSSASQAPGNISQLTQGSMGAGGSQGYGSCTSAMGSANTVQGHINSTNSLGSLSNQSDARSLLLLQQQQQLQLQLLHQQEALRQNQALQHQLNRTTSAGAPTAAQLLGPNAGLLVGGGGMENAAGLGYGGLNGGSFNTNMLPTSSMLAARSQAGPAMGRGTNGGLATSMALGLGRPGPGAIEPFPEKLHRMLLEVEASGNAHIISFVNNGRAFAIHKPNQFFKEIVPLYFRQSRLSSFKRQLNLYGFELISNGPSRGAYCHEFFQKDKPNLCRRMRRVAVKVAAKEQQQQGRKKA